MSGWVWSWPGALLGAALAGGFMVLWTAAPRRRHDVMARVGPYVSDKPRPSRLLQSHQSSGLFARTLRWLGSRVERVLGGSASVRRRLERAGQPADVEGFRAQQALWGVLGGAIGCALAAVRVLSGMSLLLGVVLVLTSITVGVVARDQFLTRQANQREERILAEFPSIAEMLALAVTAGEGAAAALERVTRLSRGELSGELERCLADARAGATLPQALQGLSDRTGVPSLARFVDGIVVAVERGTPLADVMRAQAQDARDAGKQHLIESGGQREISMMIPVVFLVLPVTILFAAYPALGALNFGM